MPTTLSIGVPITVKSSNVDPKDRFVASLVSSYGNKIDGVDSPEKAAAAAYSLTLDSHSDGTLWSVYDRQTGLTTTFEQGEFEELALEPGFIT